ncbi:probable global transcription activator SNF2L1 [Uranotaenia lowii]|uniref:probable global transcription activator SNF2L1 n=1 Tax=Uranotaenia lowii TaxID=190385 RepID=UPI00247B1919|nr:probable global transcription activator SNF2L1 [Uranotaenia lowii]
MSKASSENSLLEDSNVVVDSVELAAVQTRRLEYLESQFSNFSKFIEQRNQQRSDENANVVSPESQSRSSQRKRKIPKRLSDSVLPQDKETGNKRGTHQRESSKLHAQEVVHFSESPTFINGTMRDYQIAGLNWLISLYDNGMNGILADEMGLGKTVQSISMLGFLRYHRNIKGPHLVIVPLSTIENWEREFRKFLPEVKVLHGHCYKDGKKDFAHLLKAQRRTWDVVITSYQFFVTQSSTFQKINFHYVIVDEAQRCKNENTLLPKALRNTHFRSMLFMTGTPINNNLHELWAILNLLLPEFFRNADDFDSWFKVEDCIDPNKEGAARLKNILQPIMLRRVKADVELSLKPKMKTTIMMPQTRSMKFWSKKILAKDIQILKGNGEYTNCAIANVYPFLREATLHPYLIPGAETDSSITDQNIVDCSSRMIVLNNLLPKLKQRGSRVLIFSQFVMMQDILHDYFVWKGYKFLRLDGRLPQNERQQLIDDFNAPNSEFFICMLTTRAGGVGLNLQSADTVIFFDIDPNPQQDFQAEDRAHRIGQLKQVHVIRFCVLGTVDEYLYEVSNRKTALDKAIIKKSLGEAEQLTFVRRFSKELDDAFSLDIDAVDKQIDELFEAIDRGERSAEKKTLFQDLVIKSRTKRSRSEERELEEIKINEYHDKTEDPVIDLNSSGYTFRPRRAKKARYTLPAYFGSECSDKDDVRVNDRSSPDYEPEPESEPEPEEPKRKKPKKAARHTVGPDFKQVKDVC